MAPKADSTEAIVLNFVNEQNRPLNSQNTADALQKYGLKKTAVQKALDTLAESGQISFKEYGKQKIYLARQDQFSIPNTNELDEMKKENEKLQKQLEAARNAINDVETEIRALGSNLTLEQIREKEIKLRNEVSAMESKLNVLREGTVLVRPEERKKVQDMYNEKINQWRKRKRAFKELWDIITESMPKDLKEFKEELGIETDEDVGAGIQAGKWETTLQSCNFSSKGQRKSKSDSCRESGKEKLSEKDAALDVVLGTGGLLKVHGKKEGSSTCRAGMGVYNGIKAVVPVAWSSRLCITLVRGLPGTRKLHRRTLKALGLQKCQRTVVKDNTSSIRGMINQVKRLVAVETEAMYKARKQREFELQTLRPPIVVHHPHPVYSPVQLSQQQEGQVQS